MMHLDKSVNARTGEFLYTLALTQNELEELDLTPEQRQIIFSWPHRQLWEQMLVLAAIAKLISEKGFAEATTDALADREQKRLPVGPPRLDWRIP